MVTKTHTPPLVRMVGSYDTIPLAIPTIYALFFMQIFFRMFCQQSTTERGCLTFFCTVSVAGALLIFMNKVDIYSEEEKIKSKKVGNFADTAFHG